MSSNSLWSFVGVRVLSTMLLLFALSHLHIDVTHATDTNSNVKILYFKQKLDQFDASESRTWEQRYWLNTQYYRPGGPAFLLLSGRYATQRYMIDPSTNVTMTWMRFAEKYGAMVYYLEHRYYGESYPTPDNSIENLQYLSSRQALEDVAEFIGAMKAADPNMQDAKWVVFGGGYAGMLAAWFRMLHPELVIGAVASGAPLEVKVNVTEFMVLVAKALGKHSSACLDKIYKATSQIQIMIQNESGRRELQKKFRQTAAPWFCEPIDLSNRLDASSFYNKLVEVISTPVQYSQINFAFSATKYNIPRVCERMENSSLSTTLDRYASVVDLHLEVYGATCLTVDSYAKQIKSLRNTSREYYKKWERLWHYQVCTDVGLYACSDSKHRPFGDAYPCSDFIKLCRDIFGDRFTTQFVYNAVEETNKFYGGRAGFKATNVVLTNGDVDPWRALGVLRSPNAQSPAILIAGTAHMADMYPAGDNDPPQLTQARKLIDSEIQKWMNM